MRQNPGFEPSVRSVLNSVLPDQWTSLAGGDHLHLRVSYPLIMRTTGLGRIEGGELVLVPAARTDDVLAGARDLCRTGISGIVLFGLDPEAVGRELSDCSAPVVAVGESVELQSTRERINRYIVRRRRELFALEQHLHRELVDAAIAGVSLTDLLNRASRETGAVVLLDRGGEIYSAPVDANQLAPDDVARARRALDRESSGRVSFDGPPRMLSLEVSGGGERKGLVAAFGLSDDRPEEDEAVMGALAAAASIVLTRSPQVSIPSLDDVLARRAGSRLSDPNDAQAIWTALALPNENVLPETLQRVTSTETSGRGTQFMLGELRQAYVVVASGTAAYRWDSILAAMGARSRGPVPAVGVGRSYPGLDGAARSAREAVSALDHAIGPVTHYGDVEVSVLLLSLNGGPEFARTRLGPLMDGSPVQRELLETLRVYLATGKNAKEAARRLAVHRNTLLYRLRRAQEQLRLDWEDADAVFALDLALRLLALPAAPKGSDGDSG